MMASVANKVLDLMPPLLVAWVIDTVQGAPPGWIMALIPNQSPMQTAVFLAVLGAGIFGLESFTQWVYQWQFQRTAQHVQHDIRCHVYAHLQQQDMAYFEDQRLGQLIAIVNDDVNQLEHFLNRVFNELVQLVVLLVFALVVMGATCWPLALVSLVPVPLVVGGSLVYQRFISPFYTDIRQAVGELVARLENNLSGIQVIKSFTAEAFELGRVSDASNDYKQANIRAIRWTSMYVPMIRMLIALGFAGVLLLGSYWVLSDRGVLTIGELVLFSMMIQRLLWPLTRLGTVFDDYERANVSAIRLQGVLSQTPSITSPNHPIQIPGTTPSVVFDAVSFYYDLGATVLKDLTMTIQSGQTVGLAGVTGAGKSTLIKCLLRFYDATSGTIRVNGVSLQDADARAWRGMVSLVSQDIYLFHGRIIDNISYGTNASMDAVINAAKMAQLHSFIMTTPKGYDSMIGEKGVKLSGGQRQRLSIARAILKDAPFMVFDEATSSVDTETEAAIQRQVQVLTDGKTALIIAHRLSTIRHSDTIMVLNDGCVSESGTHDELLEKKGDYWSLWQVQTGETC
jgi:ATP-binding cassette subfamily B protein